jgi:hypothetical protein
MMTARRVEHDLNIVVDKKLGGLTKKIVGKGTMNGLHIGPGKQRCFLLK